MFLRVTVKPLFFQKSDTARGVFGRDEESEYSLADWLDRWEQEYADGQTKISRDEAIHRWEQEVKDGPH